MTISLNAICLFLTAVPVNLVILQHCNVVIAVFHIMIAVDNVTMKTVVSFSLNAILTNF